MTSLRKTWERLTETNGAIERHIHRLIDDAHSMLSGNGAESDVRQCTEKIFTRIRDLRDRFSYDGKEIGQKFSNRIHGLLDEAKGRGIEIRLPENEAHKPRWEDIFPITPLK